MRAFLLALCLAAGCGGGGSSTTVAPSPPPPAPAPGATGLLFMGNSHTSFHDVPGLVAAFVRAARPGQAVEAVAAPGWMFLEERVGDPQTLALLRGRAWSVVVLQAQKYSASGQFEYSTGEAMALIRMSRMAGAVPVLFPEWARRGIRETDRIFDLHLSIARAEPACVAPIPQAWDLALGRHPDLALHDADGNHAAAAGALLAAMVITATITGSAPSDYPTLASIGVEAEVQARLRAAAAETVLAYRPRQWCPNDPVLP